MNTKYSERRLFEDSLVPSRKILYLTKNKKNDSSTIAAIKLGNS